MGRISKIDKENAKLHNLLLKEEIEQKKRSRILWNKLRRSHLDSYVG